jgi:hypothetical protein
MRSIHVTQEMLDAMIRASTHLLLTDSLRYKWLALPPQGTAGKPEMKACLPIVAQRGWGPVSPVWRDGITQVRAAVINQR